jgi:Yip1 domain
MDLSLRTLIDEARHTFRNPRDGARRIMALDVPMNARWLALALMAIGSAILTHVSLAMIPLADRDAVINMMESPLRTAVLQGALLAVLVYAIFAVGRARGGTGSLADALIVMIWLQLLMLCLQIAQLLLQALLPPLAAVVNLAGFAIFLWLLTNFVAEVHGFRSLVAVFGGIVLGVILLGFALSVVLLLLTGGPIAGV